MRLADMHTTIHPSFCQAGIASKNERNSSKLMPPNYATPSTPRPTRSTTAPNASPQSFTHRTERPLLVGVMRG